MANFIDDLLNKAKSQMVGVSQNVQGFLGSLQAPQRPQANPVQQMFNQVGSNMNWAGGQFQQNIMKPIQQAAPMFNKGFNDAYTTSYKAVVNPLMQASRSLDNYAKNDTIGVGKSLQWERNQIQSMLDPKVPLVSPEGLKRWVTATVPAAGYTAAAMTTSVPTYLGNAAIGGIANTLLNKPSWMIEGLSALSPSIGNAMKLYGNPQKELDSKTNPVQLFAEGAAQGAVRAPIINKVTSITNPLINWSASNLAKTIGGKQIIQSMPKVAAFIESGKARQLISAIASIPEGMLINASLGMPYTPTDLVIDMAMGAGTSKQVGTNLKKVIMESLGNMPRISPEEKLRNQGGYITPDEPIVGTRGDIELQKLQDQARANQPAQPDLRMGKGLLEDRKNALIRGQGTDITELPPGDRKFIPEWQRIEQARLESLHQSEPPAPKQVLMPHEQSVVVKKKPKMSLDDDIKAFTEYPLRETVSGAEAQTNYKKLQAHGKALVDRISNGIKFYKLTEDQFTKYIENPETAPANIRPLIDAHIKLMEASYSTRENASLGKIENYYPHMSKQTIDMPSGSRQIGKDLWITSQNMDLGTSKTRKGTMVDYSTKYADVMKNYMEQTAYEKYGNRIKLEPDKAALQTKIEKHLSPDNEGKLEKPSDKLDYVAESQKISKVKNKPALFSSTTQLDTWDSLRRKIVQEKGGQKLSDSMISIRDMRDNLDSAIRNMEKMTPKQKIEYLSNNLEYLKGRKDLKQSLLNMTNGGKNDLPDSIVFSLFKAEKNFRLQNLVEEVGNYQLHESTQKYINTEIDRLMKTNKYEATLIDKVANFITGMFYKAQVWGNVNTAVVQKTESLRIPVMYGPESVIDIAKGYKDDLRTGGDVLKRYDFGDMETNISKQLNAAKETGWLKSIDEKAGKVGNFMVTVAENSKNRDFLYAAEAQGKKMGLSGKELKTFVRNELFANGFIIHEFNTPLMLKNPLVRLALQYQQYNVKLINRSLELAEQGQKGKVAGLFGSQVFGALLLAAITGKGIQTVSDKIFGISAGPAISLPLQIGTMMKEIYDAQQEEKANGTSAKSTEDYYKSRLTDLAIRNSIPFANQVMKTKGALDVMNRGYEKSEFTTEGGKKIEGVKYLAPDNPIDQTRGLLFGKSSFPQNSEFYKANDIPNMITNIGKSQEEINKTKNPSVYGHKATDVRTLLSQGNRQGAEQVIQNTRQGKAQENAITSKMPQTVQDAYDIYKTSGNSYNDQAMKDSILLQYPELRAVLFEKAKIVNGGDMNKINPKLYSPYFADYLKYQQMQDTANGSIEAKQFLANRPALKQLMSDISAFYQKNPVENFGDESTNPVPPVASNRVQQLLNTASSNKSVYNDPEVAQFLNATLEYRNKVRGLQGLDPMDKYRNIAGSKNYGVEFAGGGSKKMYLTKSYPKKMKVYKPKKLSLKGLKMPKVKLVSKAGKLPKIKSVKLKKMKVKLT